jgi:hypothetical protein
MAIVYRTAGDWGPGQGTNLTPAQVDANFYDVDQRIQAIIDNPPTAISIDHFVVEGSMFTIILTDGTEHGPFVLPIAQWRWTGEWQPDTQYFVGDLVTNDGNLYFVRVQHISNPTFDPNLFTVNGQVYILVLAKSNAPYDVGFYYNDTLIAGSDIIFLHAVVREFTIAQNFGDSRAFLAIAAATNPVILPVYQNETIIGDITFTPGEEIEGDGQWGVFATFDSEPILFLPGDRLSVTLPYEGDDAAAKLSVTIVATTQAEVGS